MNKGAAVSYEVIQELGQEGRPTDDPTKAMGADLNYSDMTLDLFLTAVQNRLRKHTPSYTFAFDNAFVKKALTTSIGGLIDAIARKTT